MARYLGRRFKILTMTDCGMAYHDAPAGYKRTPDVVRELTVIEYRAIRLSGEQTLVSKCYANGRPLGDRCIQALVEIYRALNYPAKPYSIQPEGIYWRHKTGTLVPVPTRYYGTLLYSTEHSTKTLMTINEMALVQGHNYTLSATANQHQSLTADERAFIARKTRPRHEQLAHTAEPAQPFDESQNLWQAGGFGSHPRLTTEPKVSGIPEPL